MDIEDNLGNGVGAAAGRDGFGLIAMSALK